LTLIDILNRLKELQTNLNNNGTRIDDINMVCDGDYGYIIALTSFQPNLSGEALKAKLEDLKGKQLMPDLWLFGPLLTKEDKPQTDQSCHTT